MGPVIPGVVAAAAIAASSVLLGTTVYYRSRWLRVRSYVEALREEVRRSERPALEPSLSHAIDAIAVEVERVSESQRFLTRLLSEGRVVRTALAANRTAPERQTPTPVP